MKNFKEYDHRSLKVHLLTNCRRLIRSSEFHFLIGHDQRKLTIHAGLVRNLSAPLDALINNGCMKEAVSRTATIDDVEEETFIAFCEFGYKGNYTTPCRKDKDNDSHFGAESKYWLMRHKKDYLYPT